jgi:hypothetical protein
LKIPFSGIYEVTIRKSYPLPDKYHFGRIRVLPIWAAKEYLTMAVESRFIIGNKLFTVSLMLFFHVCGSDAGSLLLGTIK